MQTPHGGFGDPHAQERLEEAWKAGFDAVGAAQLNHKVAGTRKVLSACRTHLNARQCLKHRQHGSGHDPIDYEL